MIKVCVMMSTYNGADFIEEQIESIRKQNQVAVDLYIRDDGSTDRTVELLRMYSRYDDIFVWEEMQTGVADSFWNLLERMGEYEYYAFADQDDIWDCDKLIKAVQAIQKTENYGRPLLYFSSHRKVDRQGELLWEKPGKTAVASTLGNALIFSYAQGATMVFNRPLYDNLMKYRPDFKGGGILHDAWIHKVCLCVGGSIVYDPEPHISYRIHGGNVVGTYHRKKNILTKFRRIFCLSKKNYHKKAALELLKGYSDIMPAKNRELVNLLAGYDRNIISRMRLVLSKQVFWPERKRDIIFRLYVLTGRA